MPRDYAHVPKQRHPSSLPGWAWLLAGLAIGLFVALLFYINDFTHSSKKSAVTEAFTGIFSDKKRDARDVKKQTPTAPPKPAAKSETNSKPKFDFYTILPELEVIIPKEEIKPKSKPLSGKDKPGTASANSEDLTQPLMLQAGSFRQLDEADKLRAKLALQGIVASIQTVNINQNETWHRVRIGPITQSQRLHETQRKLQNMGVASIIVKNK